MISIGLFGIDREAKVGILTVGFCGYREAIGHKFGMIEQ